MTYREAAFRVAKLVGFTTCVACAVAAGYIEACLRSLLFERIQYKYYMMRLRRGR
jgi:hypothetical protein